MNNALRIRHLKDRVVRAARVASGRDRLYRRDVSCAIAKIGGMSPRGLGWWPICVEALPENPIIYSAGVGTDVSFDIAMIQRFGAKVHAFDPTPRAVAWIAEQELPRKFQFHPVGLAREEGRKSFVPPASKSHVSYRLRGNGLGALELPVARLSSLMRDLETPAIDVLKMDIEGAEYGVVEDIVATRPMIGQVLVEFHHRVHPWRSQDTRTAVGQLREAGFRLAHVSPRGEEFVFLSADSSVSRSRRLPG